MVITTTADNKVLAGLSPKQKLQIEIITVDASQQQIAIKYPETKSTIDHILDIHGKVVFLADGADLRELCNDPYEQQGGLN